MITVYQNGNECIEQNRKLLDENPYLSAFFLIDGAEIHQVSQTNFVLKVQQGDKVLLAMRVEPYDMLVYGDTECAKELTEYLIREEYHFPGFLCDTVLGESMCHALRQHQQSYYEALAMDFMEADRVTEPSSPLVEPAVEQDVEDIFACMQHFVTDCGLQDEVTIEPIRNSIGHYRVLRENGVIASVAKIAASTDASLRISCVYSKNAYRGKGFARLVVNSTKNEILAQGKKATLTVDRHNPVTNHLYRALGFKPLFAQGEYRRQISET